MPTVRDSQSVNTARTTAAQASASTAAAPGFAPTIAASVSPFMGSSLPVRASGNDLYGRQFYGGGRLPQRRFLPVGL